MSQPSTTEPVLPELPKGWTARIPELDDLPALVALRIADQQPWTGATSVDEAGIESEIAGPASWTRRQLVAVDGDGTARAWITVHDRAAGRALVWGYFDRTIDVVDRIADAFYAWAEEQAVALARLRGIDEIRLDESPFQDDRQQVRWLRRAGYTKRRTWLHMERPVTPDDADSLPPIREGVTIRPVSSHANGLPVAGDLQVVHADAGGVLRGPLQLLQGELPGVRAAAPRGPRAPLGPLVAGVRRRGRTGRPSGCAGLLGAGRGRVGSGRQLRGVHRGQPGRARTRGRQGPPAHGDHGRRRRGRNRVGLEVDDDSPTSADQLYVSMGWKTYYVTDSWFKDIRLG